MIAETKMATDEQVNALTAAGIDEADAGSYSATEARRKLVELARPEPTPCRCGCGGLSRGLFVPGHDARHKGALARRHHEGDPDARAAVLAECDAIDAAYGRTGNAVVWRGLITKQSANIQKQEDAQIRREAKGTPVQRARRAHARVSRASTDDTEEGDEDSDTGTARERQDAYIDDLIDRLARHPKIGQLGWLRLSDQERQVARVYATHRGEGNYATMEVKIVATSQLITVQCEQWLADPDLERVGA